MNYFSLMLRKRLRNDEDGADDEELVEGGKSKRPGKKEKELKISEMDEWMNSDDDESGSDEDEKKASEEEDDAKKKKKNKGKKNIVINLLIIHMINDISYVLWTNGEIIV